MILQHSIVILANHTSITYSLPLKQFLTQFQAIHSKCIGLSNSNKNNKIFIDPPYALDQHSTLFLVEKQLILKKPSITTQENKTSKANIKFQMKFINLQVQKQYLQIYLKTKIHQFSYKIYKYLKESQKKLYILDGHKFGCNFLIYEKHPQMCHATYLIFLSQKQQKKELLEVERRRQMQFEKEVNQMTRLADMCKKRCILVCEEEFSVQKVEKYKCELCVDFERKTQGSPIICEHEGIFFYEFVRTDQKEKYKKREKKNNGSLEKQQKEEE